MDGIAQWDFFKLIFGFLDYEAEAFRDNLLGETLRWTSGIGLSLLTLWILVQGYRIATGQSHESMTLLVTRSLRSFLIVSVATSFIFGATDVYRLLIHGLPDQITLTVTGQAQAPEDLIDQSLDKMQAALIAIDALSVSGDPGLKDEKDRAQWFTGIGVAGPAVIGGAILLLYKLALALFVGLGPVFVLSLLFDQSKELFGRWLYYGLGTLFSLAVLSFMVALSMKMVLAIANAFATQYLLAVAAGSSVHGVSSLAMQQGGVGLVMTLLLIMTPRMVAQFFQGTLGDFASYSAFGGMGRRRESATHPGHVDQAQLPTEHRPTHAYRIPTAAATQQDQIKRTPAAAEGSFLERYPNATASLSGGGGSGDPLPKSLQATAEAGTNGRQSVGATTNAPVLTSGLSQHVDEIVSKSPTMRAQMDTALNGQVDWKIVYGPEKQGTFIDRDNTTITIDSTYRDMPHTTASLLAHELGHLQYTDPKPRGRSDMLEWHLKDEGVATLNSIRIRRELAAEGISIAIPTTKQGVNNLLYEKLYDDAVKTGDFDSAARAIGEIYLDTEVTGSGKTYRQHYGGGK